jgi:hypothetical protein
MEETICLGQHNCELERGGALSMFCPIETPRRKLPGWLAKHSSIMVIARDRGDDY